MRESRNVIVGDLDPLALWLGSGNCFEVLARSGTGQLGSNVDGEGRFEDHQIDPDKKRLGPFWPPRFRCQRATVRGQNLTQLPTRNDRIVPRFAILKTVLLRRKESWPILLRSAQSQSPRYGRPGSVYTRTWSCPRLLLVHASAGYAIRQSPTLPSFEMCDSQLETRKSSPRALPLRLTGNLVSSKIAFSPLAE